MSSPGEELRFRAAGLLGYGLVRSLFSTVRFERREADHLAEGRRRHGGVVFVLWHDQLLPLIHAHRNQGIVALVSEHADGEYVGRILDRYGFGTVRGSSTRGGARGLRDLVRAARRGHDLAVTPDGPRGPRHRFKEGALLAAQISGLPVLPLAATASSGWRFDSWDRFLVPKPFSTVRIGYAPPVTVPRDADREARTRLALRLERSLGELASSSGGDDGPRGEAAPAGAAGREREEGRAPSA